jgi:multisubunit Na+/H+ antiporter MnhB subunit
MVRMVMPGPLTTGFLLTSIIGFFVSAFFIYGLSPEWGFAFSVMFIIMFLASMVSFAKSDVDAKLREEVESTYPKQYKQHLDEKRKNRRRKK